MTDGIIGEGEGSHPIRAPLLAALLAAGALMIALSFLPWVNFRTQAEDVSFGFPEVSFSIDGSQLSRLRGPGYNQPADIAGQEVNPCTCRVKTGDGYIVAVLGAVVLAAAALGLALPRMSMPVIVTVIGASLPAFAVAGYNATGIWQGVGAASLEDVFVKLEGSVRLELLALTAVAGLAAIGGAALWSLEALRGAEPLGPGRRDSGGRETEEIERWASR
jgi:hypothetical protein